MASEDDKNKIMAMELIEETREEKIMQLRTILFASRDPQEDEEFFLSICGEPDLQNIDSVLDSMILAAQDLRHQAETLERQNDFLRALVREREKEIEELKRQQRL